MYFVNGEFLNKRTMFGEHRSQCVEVVYYNLNILKLKDMDCVGLSV